MWDDAKKNQQAAKYQEWLSACLDQPACTSFTVWGFTDRYTWLDELYGEAQYPLPFEATVVNGTYAPKPAFFSMIGEFESK